MTTHARGYPSLHRPAPLSLFPSLCLSLSLSLSTTFNPFPHPHRIYGCTRLPLTGQEAGQVVDRRSSGDSLTYPHPPTLRQSSSFLVDRTNLLYPTKKDLPPTLGLPGPVSREGLVRVFGRRLVPSRHRRRTPGRVGQVVPSRPRTTGPHSPDPCSTTTKGKRRGREGVCRVSCRLSSTTKRRKGRLPPSSNHSC